jgi:hypothetical protein
MISQLQALEYHVQWNRQSEGRLDQDSSQVKLRSLHSHTIKGQEEGSNRLILSGRNKDQYYVQHREG